MAARLRQLDAAKISGFLVAGLLIFLTLGTLGAVISRAEGLSGLRAGDWSAIRFTVMQAALSAALSVGFAIPVARALARRRFAGRTVLITLLGAPFILPVIVAILGLLSVFGRSGLISDLLGGLGLPPIHIYGLHGILIAHVFFNMPLATRLILQGWIAIPAERFRLAASLGMGRSDIFRTIEWPMLRAVLPGAFMVIFLICTTSFAIALALGGGPAATTIELAIYQAFKFDFELSKAALLAVVQFAICALAAAVFFKLTRPSDLGAGLDRVVERWDGSKLLDAMVICLAAAFLILPLIMILLRGVPGLLELPDSILGAAWRSVWVAVSSALLTIALSLPLALSAHRVQSRSVEVVGYLTIAASPLVMGTGLFILIYRWADPVALALPLTIVVNAAMSLPFALRAIMPALTEVEQGYARLSASLNITGLSYLRLVLWPRLRRPIGFAAGLAGALSMGDLGVIALFADPENVTLPLEMYRLMTAYRLEEAYAAALLLLALSLAIFWGFDRGGRAST